LSPQDSVFPLSYDHKPASEIESERIKKAGGFVNQFGRVNGNLNLSRSIGDLKYKQNIEVKREEQMITAEPDLITTTLEDGDEFIIIGCDGIWDCLTNEEACDFVSSRIETMQVSDIVEECLNTIVSEDPRATQGIGGDNMTLVVVDLKAGLREKNLGGGGGEGAKGGEEE
jgi:serine/threonine protein phosphatase PrpC